MSIFNKLTLAHLPLPLTTVTIQMAFTVAALMLRPSELRWGGSDDIKRWALTVPLLFVGMLASSMVAMQYATLGTMVVCRNVSPLPTMAIEGMFRIPYVMTGRTLLSLLVIIGGVVLYEGNEISFSLAALLAISVNMVFAVRAAARPRAGAPRLGRVALTRPSPLAAGARAHHAAAPDGQQPGRPLKGHDDAA